MSALRKPSPPVVKLNEATHAKLLEFSKEENRPMGEIVSSLVDRYAREKFWAGAKADLERLQTDPVAWKDYQDEVAAWDGMIGDGLEDEPPYFTPEEEREIRERARARAAVR